MLQQLVFLILVFNILGGYWGGSDSDDGSDTLLNRHRFFGVFVIYVLLDNHFFIY